MREGGRDGLRTWKRCSSHPVCCTCHSFEVYAYTFNHVIIIIRYNKSAFSINVNPLLSSFRIWYGREYSRPAIHSCCTCFDRRKGAGGVAIARQWAKLTYLCSQSALAGVDGRGEGRMLVTFMLTPKIISNYKGYNGCHSPLPLPLPLGVHSSRLDSQIFVG